MNESIASHRKSGLSLHTELSNPWRVLDNAARRTFDITTALLGLVSLLPVFCLLALLIKRDSPGPIFYRGERVGRGGRAFHLLKFRTMYETPESYAGPRVTGQGDPRITPFGHWLRDTKLNELPQLWNVLRGEMSMVGPRPEDKSFVAHWPAETREALLSVRPGVTSPASVLYRDEEVMLQTGNVVDQYLKVILPSKLRLDLLYVHHRSLLTDLDVIFWTVLALLPQLKAKRVPEHLLFWGPLAQFVSRYFSWFVLDCLSAFFAVAVTGVIWRSSGPLELGRGTAAGVALLIAVIFSLMNALLGIGRVVWSRANLNDAMILAVSSVLTTAILVAANIVWTPRPVSLPYLERHLLPGGMIITSGVLAFAGFALMRYRMRIITGLSAHWIALRGRSSSVGERVLIVGAGEAGHLAAYLLRKAELGQMFTIIGMVDDAPRKQGSRIGGMRVLGRTADIPRLVQTHDIGLVIFAIEKIGPAQRERILRVCRGAGVQTAILPDVLAALREQLALPAGSTEAGVEEPRLESWLGELDSLAQAGAWDAVHLQILAKRQQLSLQEQSGNV